MYVAKDIPIPILQYAWKVSYFPGENIARSPSTRTSQAFATISINCGWSAHIRGKINRFFFRGCESWKVKQKGVWSKPNLTLIKEVRGNERPVNSLQDSISSQRLLLPVYWLPWNPASRSPLWEIKFWKSCILEESTKLPVISLKSPQRIHGMWIVVATWVRCSQSELLKRVRQLPYTKEAIQESLAEVCILNVIARLKTCTGVTSIPDFHIIHIHLFSSSPRIKELKPSWKAR